MTEQEWMTNGTLHLGTYPYTYARVSAMKSKLIKKDDYQKLLKMRVAEIAKFLQETEYKREIDELAVSQLGIHHVESALNKNLVRAFRKLKKIAEGNLRIIIEEYLKRKDISNLKSIFRGKFTNADEKYVESLLVPAGSFSRTYLMLLFKKENVEEIAKSIPFVDLKEAVARFKEQHSLFDIENALDRYYYSEILEFSKHIPEQGNLFRTFLEHEIDVLNIKTILRLKREHFDSREIEKYLFFSGARIKKHALLAMTRMADANEVVAALKKAGYGSSLGSRTGAGSDAGSQDDGMLMDLELQLNHHLLDRAALLLHQNPLSIDVILGFMFAKEIEIRNLKTIIKGKQLGLDEAFMARELVYAK